MTDTESGKRAVIPQLWRRRQTHGPAWWVIALGAVATLIGVDVVLDWREGGHPLHIGLEVSAMFTIASVALGIISQGERRIALLSRDLSEVRHEAARWRREADAALRGLGKAIDDQFERWALSPAEREVGLLLLKGLSLKEVAALRATSDRTARDQARAIYRKSGLANRSELSAFFLEDLLLPPNRPEGSRGPVKET